MRVGGKFNLSSCVNLKSLEGINSLESVNSLRLFANHKLQNLNGLSALKRVEQSLKIENLGELTSLSGADQLEYIGWKLVISSNVSLPNLYGLPDNLQTLDIEIINNRLIKDLEGFPPINELEGMLLIQDNENLESLEGIGHRTSIGRLELERNPKLLSLMELKDVERFERGVEVYDASIEHDSCPVGEEVAPALDFFCSGLHDGVNRLPPRPIIGGGGVF